MTCIKKILVGIGCFVFVTSSAQTNDPIRTKGKIGVGASIPLQIGTSSYKTNTSETSYISNFIGGLGTVTYHATPKLPISFGFGFSSSINKTETSGYTAETIKAGPVFQVSFGTPIISIPNAGSNGSQLDFLLGVTSIVGSNKVTYTSKDATGTFTSDDNSTSLLISPTITPEWFISENLSFHTQVGIVFSILEESNSAYSEGGVNIKIFQTSDLLGNAGFTFYF